MAEELAYTCYMTFARQPTHLAPEITHFNWEESRSGAGDDFYTKPADSHYLLRPETIESLWYLYYVTGNKTYQDWGWNIFQVRTTVLCNTIMHQSKTQDGIYIVSSIVSSAAIHLQFFLKL